MLEPSFNELSIHPLCETDAEVHCRISALSKLLSKLRYYGIKTIRIENGLSDILLKDDFNLSDYCSNSQHNYNGSTPEARTIAQLFYSMFRAPYLSDDNEDIVASYSDVKYVDIGGKEHDCYGLYIAHLLKSFAIGLDTGVKSPCKIKLIRRGISSESEISEIDIIHLSNIEQLNTDMNFADLMSNQPEFSVKPVSSSEKHTNFTLPSHHGKNICYQHGKRLLEDPYIKDILTSIEWNSSEREYIHKIYPDGSIDIRLYNTSKGYGLRISTSANDLVETYWVAKHINARYGK